MSFTGSYTEAKPENGAQSASYLWSCNFLRTPILFVLNVFFFFFKREEELRDFKTSAAKKIVKSIV